MPSKTHLHIIGIAFERELEQALGVLQQERGLDGWPAAGPRFELECSTVRYRPALLVFEFEGIASILSPEREDYTRQHVRTVSEVFALEACSIEEDNTQVIAPYMAAHAAVLCYRIGQVLSERFG